MIRGTAAELLGGANEDAETRHRLRDEPRDQVRSANPSYIITVWGQNRRRSTTITHRLILRLVYAHIHPQHPTIPVLLTMSTNLAAKASPHLPVRPFYCLQGFVNTHPTYLF